jgi:N-succinyldiaminopimelate aminotransferase
VFHSLSKRSSVPGLRSGFAAGDAKVINAFARWRAYAAPTLAGPIQAASAALWADDAHVAATRKAYAEKFAVAERILGNRFAYRRPDGAFFVWLDVGNGEAAAQRLWSEAALRVMPGAYLSYGEGDQNPGAPYIRVALVDDLATTTDALTRIRETLTESH